MNSFGFILHAKEVLVDNLHKLIERERRTDKHKKVLLHTVVLRQVRYVSSFWFIQSDVPSGLYLHIHNLGHSSILCTLCV